MNNITPIKTSAMVALLMMAGQFMVSSVNAAEKEVTGMHHQQPASDTVKGTATKCWHASLRLLAGKGLWSSNAIRKRKQPRQ